MSVVFVGCDKLIINLSHVITLIDIGNKGLFSLFYNGDEDVKK
jgi:hypothetical protein